MVLMFLLLAFVIGLIIPLQATVNQAMQSALRSGSLLVALVSFAVGTLSLALIGALTGQPFATLGGLPRVPWWQWTGGVMGAFFVFGSTFLAPRIGLAAMVSLIVAGQVLSSLLFDRTGIMGLQVREISWFKALGAILAVAGVLLVNFGDRWFARV